MKNPKPEFDLSQLATHDDVRQLTRDVIKSGLAVTLWVSFALLASLGGAVAILLSSLPQ